MEKNKTQRLHFNNSVINKRQLQELMSQTFHNYGVVKSSIIADRVKNLTFHYATRSGISLNAEDLRVPFKKRQLIGLTSNEVTVTEQKYSIGAITSVERFQKVIDIWNNASNSLKDEVLTYFRESDPLNPLYIMAFSGARGNISQVRQLVGMRGLMADPQGQIIDLPIKSNFREGLKVTEYVISSYGARKGLVDTALRTADSGYLTRRLVDVAQDIIVREEDCLTKESLSYKDLFKQNPTELSLKDRLVGRLLADSIFRLANNKLIANINEEITLSLINKFKDIDLETLTVRSPLTCDSIRSVCRKCYGWNLSYSRLVDLGEAVGIVAAQSIGEPGTQLTMRTFHTGGVFSGELTRQIRAPFSGTIFYNLQSNTRLIRTRHGENGFMLNEDVLLVVENINGTRCTVKIPSGNVLLVNNAQKVYESEILVEIKKDANLIVEEDRKHIYNEVSGEIFFQNIKVENILDKQGSISNISKGAGLIWVLHGERYSLPNNGVVNIPVGQQIFPSMVLAKRQVLNDHSGIVKFDETGKIKIRNFSLTLENSRIRKSVTGNSILTIFNQGREKTFELIVKNKEFLIHGQTIAVLNENLYKTQAGGVVCYDLEDKFILRKRQNTKKIFTGSLYWISEETHILNLSIIEKLRVQNNTLIKPGTELWPGKYSKLGGLVTIDDLTKELIIKPGELFSLINTTSKSLFRDKRFLKPGQFILDNVVAQRLSYLEKIEIQGFEYLLIRPVITHKVPKEKGFLLEHLFFPTDVERQIKLRTIKRIFYKNWEKVKTDQSVNLLQTSLILDVNLPGLNLKPQIEIIESYIASDLSKLKVSLYETLKLRDSSRPNTNENIQSSLQYLVSENQYVSSKTAVADIKISTHHSGTLLDIKNNDNGFKDLLILKNNDIKKIYWFSTRESLVVKNGDLVRIGSPITTQQTSRFSGQIYTIGTNFVLIRLGRPYLISEGTILRVKPSNTVHRSDILATLVYGKLKTVDIVQGLPKVEEILEARKIKGGCLLAPSEGQAYLRNSKIEVINIDGIISSINVDTTTKPKFLNGSFVNLASPLTDGQISPHDMLETLFNYYKTCLPIEQACRTSFKYLQLFLVNEVQRTYLSQNVHIADKHIEVIVKQMTSKVKVDESGFTTLLPGEIVSLNQAENMTQTARSLKEEPPFYSPILLGLTKASLNSDSFISAASFQETTRVLTEAAIEGKKDWLNGLKENVIIGRLIPAGTGFNTYESLKKFRQEAFDPSLTPEIKSDTIKMDLLKFRIKTQTG